MLGYVEFIFMAHSMVEIIGMTHCLDILLRKEEKRIEHGTLENAHI